MTPPLPGTPTGADRAWGWVAHLRAGGTTPWERWQDSAGEHGRVVPGAQQLELLRRLNLAGRPSPVLADRVLAASAPGRGQLDLELVGVRPESPFGPRPVDPGTLPDGELVRVATSLLAEDLVTAGVPDRRRPLTRPWRRPYRLAGDPLVVHGVRSDLVARGRPPAGPDPTAYVLATPLDRMLADTWTWRCFEQGAAPWPQWLDSWVQRDRLPPRIDLVAVADAWAARLGPDRVRIVLDPARLPPELGVRRLAPVPRPGADAVELARRVAAVVGLLVVPARRAELLGGAWWPRLAHVGGPPVGLPDEAEEWVARRAHRMVRQLRRGGYPVLGDLASLVPRPELPTGPGPTTTSEAGVLDLAISMLLTDDQARRAAADRPEERG
jgi:hypothetical protein